MYRTVRWEDEFTELIEKLLPEFPELGAAIAGVEFAVCQNPEEFTEIPGTPFRLASTVTFPGVPAVSVFFTVEEPLIVFWRGKRFDVNEEGDD